MRRSSRELAFKDEDARRPCHRTRPRTKAPSRWRRVPAYWVAMAVIVPELAAPLLRNALLPAVSKSAPLLCSPEPVLSLTVFPLAPHFSAGKKSANPTVVVSHDTVAGREAHGCTCIGSCDKAEVSIAHRATITH